MMIHTVNQNRNRNASEMEMFFNDGIFMINCFFKWYNL